MSASTEKRDLTTHNREATYNVARGSRRRVKWLAGQGDEITDTRAEGYNRLRKKSSSGNAGSEVKHQDSVRQNVKLENSDDGLGSEKELFLPSLTSQLVDMPRTLSDKHDPVLTDIASQPVSNVHAKRIMSSKGRKLSSKSTSILRKEDTFIVSEKESESGLISPTEELRRRKAMVLAQANARHAVKQLYDDRVVPQQGENHQNNIPRSRNQPRQANFRSYIKNISSEVRNNRGEKIYFQWTEGILSGGTHASRVPQGVIKLYEYKKKRLRQKYSHFLNSKSAPNNKQELDKLQSGSLKTIKRGKTADGEVSHSRRCSASANKRRHKARVAFVVSANEDESVDSRKGGRLATCVSGNEKTQIPLLNNCDEENILSRDGESVVENKQTPNTAMVADISKTPYFINQARFEKQAEATSALRQPYTHSQATLQRPSIAAAELKTNSKPIFDSNKKVNSLTKLESSRVQRKERNGGSSRIIITNPLNNNKNSTKRSENDARVLDFSSNQEAAITSPTDFPKDAGFDTKCRDLISVYRIGTANDQSMIGFQSNRLVSRTEDNDISSSYRKRQMYCRNSTTKVVDQVSDARLPALDQARVVGLDEEERTNHRSPREPGFQDSVDLIGSSMPTRRAGGSIHENISNDCSAIVSRQPEHSGLTLDTGVNGDVTSNNNNSSGSLEPFLRISVQQDNSHMSPKSPNSCSTNTNITQIRNEQAINALITDKEISTPFQNEQGSFHKSVEKKSENKLPRAKPRTRDKTCVYPRSSVQIRGDVEGSNVSIDQSSVITSVQPDNMDGACDPHTQPEPFSSEPDTQYLVTNPKPESEIVACPCAEKSQLDASVATATSKVNTDVTTTTSGRKQVEGTNRSLRSIDPCPKFNSEGNEKSHQELPRNNLSERSQIKQKETTNREGDSPSQLPGHNTNNVFVDKHSDIWENPDSNVVQLVPNGLSQNGLQLDLLGINADEEVTAPCPSISRYINGIDLPQGQSHSLNYAQNNKNMATSVASQRQSKTVKILPTNKEVSHGLCSDGEKGDNGASIEGGKTKDLNIAVSVNSESKVHESCANSGSCEDTSISRQRSIHDGKCISKRIITDLSSREAHNAGGALVNSEKCHCANVAPTTDNTQNHICALCNANICFNGDTNIFPPTVSTHVNGDLNNGQETNTILKKDTKHNKVETQDKFDSNGKKINQNSKVNGREQNRKREVISLPTQNMEFVKITKGKETQNNESDSYVVHSKLYTVPESTDTTKGERLASVEKETRKEREIHLVYQQSDRIQSTTSRPKTAGLSAFSKGRCEDLWSVRTEGEEDDDDDDDNIQFIEGEQDFFKVFGYNEETVAILNATKVYPVSGSVGPSWEFGQSGGDVATRNDIYADNHNSLSGVVVKGDVSGKVVSGVNVNCVAAKGDDNIYDDAVNGTDSFDSCVDSGARTNESKSIQKYDESWQRKDNKKPFKLNNKLPANATKPVDKCSQNLQNEATVEAPIYVSGQVRANTHHQTNATDEVSTLTAHSLSDNSHDQNGKATEPSYKPTKNGLSYVQAHGQSKKGITTKAHIIESTSTRQPAYQGRIHLKALTLPNTTLTQPHNSTPTDTLARLGDARESHETTSRRRIHSEADIVTTNMDNAHTLSGPKFCSDESLNNNRGNVVAVRDGALPPSKDPKSHVALRNQLATERHISQTRYHRHINNNLAQHHKAYLLETSLITDSQISRPKDRAEIRLNKTKDSIKVAHFRGIEPINHPGVIPFNPYMQAANRIMSKFAEHSKYNNYESSNIPGAKFHESPRDTSITNSPLRRMSHPVDNRLTPQSRSYYGPRPRKLDPIAQVAGVQQNQD